MKNEDDALDIVQDAYIKAFDRIDQLDNALKFESWLNRIVASTALDALKKKKPLLFTDISNDDEKFDVAERFEADYSEQPEVVIDKNETSRLVQEIIGELSDEQRVCVTMYYIQEMPVKEISEVLDVSDNTVMSRLHYARKNIEKKVKELEKKGAKLYALAPIPFFVFLLGKEADACEATTLAGLYSASAGAGVTSGAMTGATTMSLGAKIAIGITAGVLVIGGAIGAGILVYNSSDDSQNEEYISSDNNESDTEEKQEQTVNSKEILSNYYDSNLVPQYGVADPDMSANYYEDEDGLYAFQGFSGRPGLMGKKFADVDNDGMDEMIVAVCEYLNPANPGEGGKIKQDIYLYKLEKIGNQVKELTNGGMYLESYTGFNDTIQCAYRIVDGKFNVYYTKIHWNTLREGGIPYSSATVYSFDGNNVVKLVAPTESYENVGGGNEAMHSAEAYMPTIVAAWDAQYNDANPSKIADKIKIIGFSSARNGAVMFSPLSGKDPEYKNIFSWNMMRKRTDDYKEYGPINGIVYGYWDFYE